MDWRVPATAHLTAVSPLSDFFLECRSCIPFASRDPFFKNSLHRKASPDRNAYASLKAWAFLIFLVERKRRVLLPRPLRSLRRLCRNRNRTKPLPRHLLFSPRVLPPLHPIFICPQKRPR